MNKIKRVPFGGSEVTENIHKFKADTFAIFDKIHEIDENILNIKKNISPINEDVDKKDLRITNYISNIKTNIDKIKKDIYEIIEIISE